MHDDLTIRAAVPADYDSVVAVVDSWWGRPIAGALQRVFLDHFSRTSLVAERSVDRGGVQMTGFLVGFASPDDAEQAYIHFVGWIPVSAGQGWDVRCTSGSST